MYVADYRGLVLNALMIDIYIYVTGPTKTGLNFDLLYVYVYLHTYAISIKFL